MNALHFQEGFINERLEIFSFTPLFSLSHGAFPFASVDTAGLQLGTEDPS